MYLSKRFAALPPRQKLLARLALYGGLAAAIALGVLGISYLDLPIKQGSDHIVNFEELKNDPSVLILQDYIRIDTSTTTGSELAGALFLAEHLEAAGLEVHLEHFEGDKANLWPSAKPGTRCRLLVFTVAGALSRCRKLHPCWATIVVV